MADSGQVNVKPGGFGRWRTVDVVVAAALAVPLGILWWAYGTLWFSASVALPVFGAFLDGFYVITGVLVAYVIRRPGAALVGELISALVEMAITPWGFVVLQLGFYQGLGAEAVFLATRYRHFGWPVLLLAGMVGSAVMFVGYTVPVGSFAELDDSIKVAWVVSKLVGGAILGGALARPIAEALARTGVLDNFPIGRARRVEV